jgi:hypothetical protein
VNKNLSDILSNVQNEITDTSTSIQSIIKNYINRRYFQILRAINWEYINSSYTFNTVAGTQNYVLPDDFGKPLVVRDVTNNREISEIDYQNLISKNVSNFSTAGIINQYSILEDKIQNQPTSASQLSIVSSSVSDTTQSIFIRGISSGAETYETVALNGTSSADTVNSYTRIISISKDTTSTGVVTITSNSGAVTIVVIAPVATTPFFKKIAFHYVPTGVVTIAIPYYVKPFPMVNDNDYPIIDISDGIELGAMADALRYKRQFAKASVFEGQFAQFLNDYIWDKENKPNQVQQFIPATFNRDGLY